MTVYFKDIDTTRDWRVVVEELSLGAAEAIVTLSPVALYKGVKAAITDSVPNPDVDQIAGIWLRVTATSALFGLLDDPRFGGPLGRNGARKAAAKTFVTEMLALEGFDRFDQAIVENPSTAPALATIIERLPDFVREGAAIDLTDEDIRRDYARRLRAVSARVHAIDPEFYAPLAAALDSPLAAGFKRDLEWARHANWVKTLFDDDPIFSPDESEKRSLSSVYHRSRCFWHVERDGEETETRPRFGEAEHARHRTAHIADLHGTLHAWLHADTARDRLRLVAGGPGSGKSSASRAFASEIIEAGRHRLIYIRLQHMSLGGLLYDRIGAHLRQRHNDRSPSGNEGFSENPLDWMSNDETPMMLIFDGLDEPSHTDDTARDLCRKFIGEVRHLLASLEAKRADARALILGRNAAVRAGLDETRLPMTALLNVAPLTPLEADTLTQPDAIVDPQALAERDERPDFWRRMTGAAEGEPVSEAVTAEQLGELNAEPLLLHLLIVSGYSGEKWRDAADNHNLIYESIFEKIHARDQTKSNAPNLDRSDFFTLLECLGLAAWRGNGRTGSAEEFARIRDLHCSTKQKTRFKADTATELGGVAVQFYTRHDVDGQGFEFIHKSFGEYLAARALLAAALRCARLLSGDEP